MDPALAWTRHASTVACVKRIWLVTAALLAGCSGGVSDVVLAEELPIAARVSSLSRGYPVVSIREGEVFVGRTRVDDAASLAAPDYWNSSGLREALRAGRFRPPSRWCLLSSAAECNKGPREFDPVQPGAQLVAKAGTPFELVKKVWFILRIEGYREIQFVARDEGGKVGQVDPPLSWVDRQRLGSVNPGASLNAATHID